MQQFTPSQPKTAGGGGTMAGMPGMSAAAATSTANLGASALVSTANTAHSHTITHSNGTTKTMFNRAVPEDRAKAAGVVRQLMNSTA